jgi:hypothetical protein
MEPTSTGRSCPKCGSNGYLFRGRKKVSADPGKAEAVETGCRCKAAVRGGAPSGPPDQPPGASHETAVGELVGLPPARQRQAAPTGTPAPPLKHLLGFQIRSGICSLTWRKPWCGRPRSSGVQGPSGTAPLRSAFHFDWTAACKVLT